MYRHRFRNQAAPPPPPSPAAFMPCPVVCLPAFSVAFQLWQQALYQWAFAEAQAIVQPSLPERDLLAVWN